MLETVMGSLRCEAISFISCLSFSEADTTTICNLSFTNLLPICNLLVERTKASRLCEDQKEREIKLQSNLTRGMSIQPFSSRHNFEFPG